MKGSVLARLRRVSTSPEGRALVHAVDDAGLEYKIEVPLEAVRGVSPDQGHVLVLSWSIEPSTRAAEPAAASIPAEPSSTATTRVSTTSEVDRAFMALMGRPRGSTSAAESDPATSTSVSTATNSTSQGLAELLGLKHI
ncbi:hypothetical protein [Nannocystis bainbridge]|uniref:Uncharacterized protein n=1 Tax=Nannocystis bainbridge TaxID=2995303 RepID=A0ABT5E4U0_9BACT|nr:hypothetical protein [Nannocystis bainbridge]MDC0720884.1 hypothetical protein [Nannocystis bainbridge]